MRFCLSALVAMMLVLSGQAFADGGTPEQAKALVERAVLHIKEVGKEKAFADFDDPKGQFVDRDLYMIVQDMKATILAHGANKALIGKSLYDLKDADGKMFAREWISVAETAGQGWVNYKWPNPITKKIEEKTTFVTKVDDVMLGCGAYKP